MSEPSPAARTLSVPIEVFAKLTGDLADAARFVEALGEADMGALWRKSLADAWAAISSRHAA